MDGLQQLINKVSAAGVEQGLNIKSARLNLWYSTERDMSLNDSLIERINRFKYLGSRTTESLDPDIEVKARIKVVIMTFKRIKSLFCNNDLNPSYDNEW